jgi:DNA-binding transcriptional LysR family regulator
MTLVQLRHFVALAEAGSFSKAAARVFLTQPALSRSIQSLEDEWGAPLFDRVGRRIELTPYGREALPAARRLLEDADQLGHTGPRLRQVAAGALRVGMGSGAGAMLMTPLLLEMARHHRHMQVEVARGRTELLVQALRDRQLDALVVDARSLRPEPDLRAEFLHEMAGAFMVRRGHPLLREKRGVPFKALLDYPIASTPLSDEVARILVERYGPQANPALCVTLRCEEVSSLVDTALKTDAVVLAIRGAAPQLQELRLQPLLAASARFGLVTLARRTEHPGVAIVRELMDRHLV